MNKSKWIKECKLKNKPIIMKTDGGYSYEEVMDNKTCSKYVQYWFNIEDTERFLFKSSTAESWEFFDPDVVNPIRNTNQIYLRFLNINEFIESGNYYRKHGVYTYETDGKMAFNAFWTEEENKCLNGVISDGVYITGRYYFLVNFGFFKAIPVDENGEPTSQSKRITLLRFIDLQYYLFHELEECWLSGNYSDKKKYLEWFPERNELDFIDLKFQFFVASKGRRKGWSASIGIGGISYNFIFKPESKSIIGAEEKSHYKPMQKGIKDTRNAINKHTPWKRPLDILGRADHYITGIKTTLEDGTIIEEGYLSEIEFLSFPDPFKGIGDSAELINIEEPGKFTHLLATLKVSIEPVLREGNTPIGPCVLGGTAGDLESGGSQALQELMYKPDAYRFKSYQNIYEKTHVETRSGWFIDDLWFLTDTMSKRKFLKLDESPKTVEYLNQFEGEVVQSVDKYGNSYRYLAKILLEKKREDNRQTSSEAYQKFITQQPMYLSEAFLINEMSPFDVGLAQEALGKLMVKESTIPMEKGRFIDVKTVNNVGYVDWKMDFSLQHINRFPWKGDDKKGCWVIYTHPVKSYRVLDPEEIDRLRQANPDDVNATRSEFIENHRYISGTDPIDWGSGETSGDSKNHSLASTWIIDTYTRQIVAEYLSRPYKSDDYFKELRQGLEYYNAINNPETNIKGILTYFKTHYKSYLITDELQSLKDKLSMTYTKNATKGTKASPRINSAARELIHRWTTELVRTGQDEEGNDILVPRMMTIPSVRLLQEIISWNINGNFDSISGLGMVLLMLFDREYGEEMKNTKHVEDRLSTSMFKAQRNKLKIRNNTYNGKARPNIR